MHEILLAAFRASMFANCLLCAVCGKWWHVSDFGGKSSMALAFAVKLVSGWHGVLTLTMSKQRERGRVF